MNRSNKWGVVNGRRKPDYHIEVFEDSMGVLHAAARENKSGRWWFGSYEGDARYIEMPHGRYYLSETHMNERGELRAVGVACAAQHAADEFALIVAGCSPFDEWVNVEDPRKVNRNALLVIAQGESDGHFAFYDSNMGETGKAFQKFFKTSPNRALTRADIDGTALPMEKSLHAETHAEEMPYAMRKALWQWVEEGNRLVRSGVTLQEMPAPEIEER